MLKGLAILFIVFTAVGVLGFLANKVQLLSPKTKKKFRFYFFFFYGCFLVFSNVIVLYEQQYLNFAGIVGIFIGLSFIGIQIKEHKLKKRSC
jgi:FtsH-binding integral membrane protein